MSEASSAPGGNPHEIGTLKFLGMEFPLPAWARVPLSIIVVIAVPIFIFITLEHMHSDANANQALNRTKEQLQQITTDLKNAQDRLRNARDDYEEYVRHTSESGAEFHHDPNLTVKYYQSDGCIYVLRAANGVWLKDPTRGTAPAPSPGKLHATLQVPLAAASVIPAVYSPASGQAPGVVEQRSRTRGACLNPHPGKYQSRDGQRRGCWLQVWRQWADGCQHYQWFNTCSSYWDTDSRGQPVVYWTSCTH